MSTSVKPSLKAGSTGSKSKHKSLKVYSWVSEEFVLGC